MDIKKQIPVIIGMIVALIVAVTMIGTLAGTVDDGADAITQDARCTDAGCFWNSTNAIECTIAQPNSTIACATAHTNTAYPLESLFNTGGIIILLFIAGGLLLTVGIVWNGYKNK